MSNRPLTRQQRFILGTLLREGVVRTDSSVRVFSKRGMRIGHRSALLALVRRELAARCETGHHEYELTDKGRHFFREHVGSAIATAIAGSESPERLAETESTNSCGN